MAPVENTTDPITDAQAIVRELERFNPELAAKERWLVLNKCDLLTGAAVDEIREKLEAALDWRGPVYVISALAGIGTRELAADVMRRLEKLVTAEL